MSKYRLQTNIPETEPKFDVSHPKKILSEITENKSNQTNFLF